MAAPPGEDALLSDARAWAATRLGLADSATESDSAGQLLRSLANHGFLPGVSEHESMRLLVEPGAAAADPFSLEATAGSAFEQFLRGRIEAFAAECFSLAPAERRARWDDLDRHAFPFASLTARLEDLRPALAVQPEQANGGPPLASELRDAILRLGVLPQPARAAARQEFLSQVALDPRVWSAPARWLRRNRTIAGLEPALIRQLIDWKRNGNDRAMRRFFGKMPIVVTTVTRSPRATAIYIGVVILVSFVIPLLARKPRRPPQPKVYPIGRPIDQFVEPPQVPGDPADPKAKTRQMMKEIIERIERNRER